MSIWKQTDLIINTPGRSAIDVSDQVAQVVAACHVDTGLVNVFLKHTSASLMLSENVDATVLQDLEMIMTRLAPDGDSEYRHDYEGDDDMAAHVRSVLTSNSISLPISQGAINFGTWQGWFLFEHRYQPHSRTMIITVSGV